MATDVGEERTDDDYFSEDVATKGLQRLLSYCVFWCWGINVEGCMSFGMTESTETLCRHGWSSSEDFSQRNEHCNWIAALVEVVYIDASYHIYKQLLYLSIESIHCEIRIQRDAVE